MSWGKLGIHIDGKGSRGGAVAKLSVGDAQGAHMMINVFETGRHFSFHPPVYTGEGTDPVTPGESMIQLCEPMDMSGVKSARLAARWQWNLPEGIESAPEASVFAMRCWPVDKNRFAVQADTIGPLIPVTLTTARDLTMAVTPGDPLDMPGPFLVLFLSCKTVPHTPEADPEHEEYSLDLSVGVEVLS